jgi:predicted esterase
VATDDPGPVSRGLSTPAYADLGEDQELAPIFPPGAEPTVELWQCLQSELREQWERLLGQPSFGEYGKDAEIIRRFEVPEFRGRLFRQATGPSSRQLVLLMEPWQAPRSPRPGAVVPYYHPDDMAGYNLTSGERLAEQSTVQFALHLVRQGYVVVCPEAFPYNTVPEPVENVGFAWWQAAAEKVLLDNPRWTGMGKLIHDTRRAVDLLLEQPDVDPGRLVAIGHSLGGKMAFTTGCLDERIKAIIASDFGIGWSFTNWDDLWYLGRQIHAQGFALAHHQLLALHAPRSFLLIGGQYDKPESWQYLREAQKVYRLYGRDAAVGMFDHSSGHQPTEESIRVAYRWLAEQFRLPEQSWEG